MKGTDVTALIYIRTKSENNSLFYGDEEIKLHITSPNLTLPIPSPPRLVEVNFFLVNNFFSLTCTVWGLAQSPCVAHLQIFILLFSSQWRVITACLLPASMAHYLRRPILVQETASNPRDRLETTCRGEK